MAKRTQRSLLNDNNNHHDATHHSEDHETTAGFPSPSELLSEATTVSSSASDIWSSASDVSSLASDVSSSASDVSSSASEVSSSARDISTASPPHKRARIWRGQQDVKARRKASAPSGSTESKTLNELFEKEAQQKVCPSRSTKSKTSKELFEEAQDYWASMTKEEAEQKAIEQGFRRYTTAGTCGVSERVALRAAYGEEWWDEYGY
ncbi:hypothetical protein V8E54_000601 [Elaphomyces granulatus]